MAAAAVPVTRLWVARRLPVAGGGSAGFFGSGGRGGAGGSSTGGDAALGGAGGLGGLVWGDGGGGLWKRTESNPGTAPQADSGCRNVRTATAESILAKVAHGRIAPPKSQLNPRRTTKSETHH